jgi:hypothetical protein
MSDNSDRIGYRCETTGNDAPPLNYIDAFLTLEMDVDPVTAIVSGIQAVEFACGECGRQEIRESKRLPHSESDDASSRDMRARALFSLIPYQNVKGFVPKLGSEQATTFHANLGAYQTFPVKPLRNN